MQKQLKKLADQIGKKIPLFIQYAWVHLDPKLKYTILTAGITYVFGATFLTGPQGAIIAGVVGSFIGYKVPNQGSVAKAENTNNNPNPAEVRKNVPDPDRTDTPNEDQLELDGDSVEDLDDTLLRPEV